jgi:hypothetical protein
MFFAFFAAIPIRAKWEISRRPPIISDSEHVGPTTYNDTTTERPIFALGLVIATSRLCCSFEVAQKSSKSANSPILADSDHAVPGTYANQNRRTPIFSASNPHLLSAGSTFSSPVYCPMYHADRAVAREQYTRV